MKRTGPNVFLPAPARAATTARTARTARTASNIRPACHSRKAYQARTARSTPVGLDPLLQRMRRFQFLRELDWAELNELAASAVVVELAAGRCVTRPRRSLPGRWFLLDGVLVDEVTGRRLRSDRKCGQAQLYPGYEHLVALTKVRLLRVDSPVPPVIPAQQSGSIESVIDVLEPTDRWLTSIAASPLLQTLYRRLGQAGWRHWFAGLEPVAMARGQRIISSGDPARYFYLVQSGRVRIAMDSRETALAMAENTTTAISVGEGGFFGEDGLLTGAPRNATAMMSGSGVLLRGERVHLEYLLDALWWELRRGPVRELGFAPGEAPSAIVVPSCASGAALRRWLAALARYPELTVGVPDQFANAQAGVLDLALLLLAHRGTRLVLADAPAGGSAAESRGRRASISTEPA